MKILPAIFSALLACSTWAQQSSSLSLDHNNVSCLLDDEGGFFNNLQSGWRVMKSLNRVDYPPFLRVLIGWELRMWMAPCTCPRSMMFTVDMFCTGVSLNLLKFIVKQTYISVFKTTKVRIKLTFTKHHENYF